MTFFTYDDEPYGENNLYINWGIFQDANDADISKVYGQSRPYIYFNALRYSDSFDREYIFLSLVFSAILSILGPFAWPFQYIIYQALEVYVGSVALTQSINLFDTYDSYKQQMQYSLSNYFLECFLRFFMPISVLKQWFFWILPLYLILIGYGAILPTIFYNSTSDVPSYIFGFIVPVIFNVVFLIPLLLITYPVNILFNSVLALISFWYLAY